MVTQVQSKLRRYLLSFRVWLFLVAILLLVTAVIGVPHFLEVRKWEKVLAKINPACKPDVEWEKGKPVKIFFADPLRNFYLTDDDLAVVGKIPSLRWVHITYAPNISGRGLENLRSLKDLRVLTLYDTRLTGDDLKHLKNFPELRTLCLSGNKNITDKGLEHLLDIPKLSILTMLGVDITDAGLPTLAKLPSIKHLWFGPIDSNLTIEAIEKLQKEHPAWDISATRQAPCDLGVGNPSTATDLTFEDFNLPHDKSDSKLRILVSEIKEPGLGALMIVTVKKEQLSRFGLQSEDIQAAAPQLLDAFEIVHNSWWEESLPSQAAEMFLAGRLMPESDKSKSDAINKILDDGIEICLQFGLKENVEVYPREIFTGPPEAVQQWWSQKIGPQSHQKEVN